MKFRLLTILTGVFFVFGSLVFNLYRIQISEGGFYSAKAESQYSLSGVLEPRRGSIYFLDKNNNHIPAVLNKGYPIIFAVPDDVIEVRKTARALAEILPVDEEILIKKLSKKNDLYELLETRVSESQVRAIQELKLVGIFVETQEFRFYPFKTLASQVLGFVGENSEDGMLKGRYGLESFYDGQLRGEQGKTNGEEVTKPRHGSDLVLTIDRNIQAQAEEILRYLVDRFDAEGGTVIVEDPKTGKILTMGSYPTFDPNGYSEYPISTFINPAIQNVYEPGSVFKVITMATGIDTGAISPETTYYDAGSLMLNGRTITNWDEKAYGNTTMTEVIEHSINTGAAFAVGKIGHESFYRYLTLFGFGKTTGIGLPGEVEGSLKTIEEQMREINFATASFGQGVSVTPLQLINAISALANDGVLMKPYILETDSPHVFRRVVSKESAKKVTDMMISAVNKAEVAHIPGFLVAGKTGTAQVPDFRNGGYAEEYIHTYVGFAPASNPQFTILIKLDKPKNALLAGQTVVPAFHELAQFILNYYTIAPDSLSEEETILP